MKKVFTAPEVITCDLVGVFLKGSGIEFFIKNAQGSGLAGEGLPILGSPNLVWAWPEIWVNDDQLDDAIVVVENFNSDK